MNASEIVERLLEADDITPEEVAGTTPEVEFRSGLDYILDRGSDIYKRLLRSNAIQTLRKERPYDQMSVSTAVLLLALDNHGSIGVDRAYRSLKRLSRDVI